LDDGARSRLELVESSECLERVPQVEMRVGLVEVEPDSLPAGLHRFDVPSLRQQGASERGASLAGFRIDSDRGAIGGLGLGVAMLLGENLAEITVRPRVVRPEADGFPERSLSVRVTRLPVERDAEPTTEHWILRPQRDRLAVRGLGLDVLTLATQAEREVGTRLHQNRPKP